MEINTIILRDNIDTQFKLLLYHVISSQKYCCLLAGIAYELKNDIETLINN